MNVSAAFWLCLSSSLRLPILFAPLREMYFSFGDISRKGAKAYLSRKENQSRYCRAFRFVCSMRKPVRLVQSKNRNHGGND